MPTGYRHLPGNDPEGYFTGMGTDEGLQLENFLRTEAARDGGIFLAPSEHCPSADNSMLARFAGGASLQAQLEKAWIYEDDEACHGLNEALRIQRSHRQKWLG